MVRLIVALDLGTSCGWAVLLDPGDGCRPWRVASGVWKLWDHHDDNAGTHPGTRWVRFTDELRELIEEQGTRFAADEVILAFEDVKRHAGTRAAHVYGALRSVVEVVGLIHGLRPRGVGVKVWKKLACGNGNASKPLYIKAMNKRWRMRMNAKREDEAAALGVATAVLEGA